MNKGRIYKTVQEFYKPQVVTQSGEPRNFTPIVPRVETYVKPVVEETVIDMKWEPQKGSTSNPSVWGPAFWFSLHNGSLRYPEHASKIVADRMKGFIMGIPYILPCQDCSEHARAHIENNYKNLDDITSSRDKLFCFFVDFHNYVNKRYNKPIMSCAEAKKLYSGSAEVMKCTYKKQS